jgi:hypothetical protein
VYGVCVCVCVCVCGYVCGYMCVRKVKGHAYIHTHGLVVLAPTEIN